MGCVCARLFVDVIVTDTALSPPPPPLQLFIVFLVSRGAASRTLKVKKKQKNPKTLSHVEPLGLDPERAAFRPQAKPGWAENQILGWQSSGRGLRHSVSQAGNAGQHTVRASPEYHSTATRTNEMSQNSHVLFPCHGSDVAPCLFMSLPPPPFPSPPTSSPPTSKAIH